MALDLSVLFTPDALASYMGKLPELKTPVMDSIFTDRPQLGLPVVGSDLVSEVIQPLPLVRRGNPSIPASKKSESIAVYEPFPIRISSQVTAADLNNLKMLGSAGLAQWATNKTDILRRKVRKTCEAMCAVALSGTLTWPVKLEDGGWDSYTVAFGSNLSVTPDVLWDAEAVMVADVFATLTAMEEAINEYGYGDMEIWAGKSAYAALFKIAENHVSTAQIAVSIADQGINIGGYLVKRHAEKYRHPQTGTMTNVLADTACRMIAKDAGMKMPYCAVDDLDANLLAMPFFIKPILQKDPSGYKLVAESKPFPLANPYGVCDATVTSS